MNLAPAVADVGFGANVDIRDTVNYKEVMRQYELGPNGAIMTSLNLFATRFNEVLGLVEKRATEAAEAGDPLQHVLVDTPGQIEVFTWSASGTIVTDALASTMPTVLVYVVDTPRCANPVTFMSNMLYACSILCVHGVGNGALDGEAACRAWRETDPFALPGTRCSYPL